MVLNQYDVVLVNLDPTIGSEINKTRPCLIISPNEINHNIQTITIAPMTTKSRAYPTRIPIKQNNTNGWVILDQIMAVDKKRIIKSLGRLKNSEILLVKQVMKQTFVD